VLPCQSYHTPHVVLTDECGTMVDKPLAQETKKHGVKIQNLT